MPGELELEAEALPDMQALSDAGAIEGLPKPRDLPAELDALRAALVKKGAVSEDEIEAEKTAEIPVPVSRA